MILLLLSFDQFFCLIESNETGKRVNSPWWSKIKISGCNKVKSKVGDCSEDDQKAPVSIATTRSVGEGTTPFPRLLHFTLDPYLILLIVKQGGIKYHF